MTETPVGQAGHLARGSAAARGPRSRHRRGRTAASETTVAPASTEGLVGEPGRCRRPRLHDHVDAGAGQLCGHLGDDRHPILPRARLLDDCEFHGHGYIRQIGGRPPTSRTTFQPPAIPLLTGIWPDIAAAPEGRSDHRPAVAGRLASSWADPSGWPSGARPIGGSRRARCRSGQGLGRLVSGRRPTASAAASASSQIGRSASADVGALGRAARARGVGLRLHGR